MSHLCAKQTDIYTNRQTTLRVTFVETDRVYAMHTMRPNNNNNNN